MGLLLDLYLGAMESAGSSQAEGGVAPSRRRTSGRPWLPTPPSFPVRQPHSLTPNAGGLGARISRLDAKSLRAACSSTRGDLRIGSGPRRRLIGQGSDPIAGGRRRRRRFACPITSTK